MPFFFANPAGFFALLGIPVLLAIYFFQRQAKEYLAPTMFLLKSQFEHRSGGRQFKRFQPSWSLLLQILALLLLAFLLAQPRWKKTEVTQKVALVVDSSASMSAFKKELAQEVERVFSELSEETSSFSIQVFQSLPESPALYSGASPAEAQRVIKEWNPLSGAVDPSAALNVARSRVGAEGMLLYLTDHLPEGRVSAGARILAVGRPLNNVGFCGVSVKKDGGKDLAQVLVKNYGTYTEARTYQLQTPQGEVVAQKEISLQPGQVKTLTYPFSAERKALCFALEADEFPLDDTAPVLLPQKKRLMVSAPQTSPVGQLGEKLTQALEAEMAGEGARPDLVLQSQPAGALRLPAAHSINFVKPVEGRSLKINTAPIIPAASPLTRDLVWDTLLIPESPSFPITARDQVLLWAGEQPLLSLRSTAQGENTFQHLLCHFPLRGSNADTQANLAILLFRFAEEVREQKPVFFSALAEVNQPLRTFSLPYRATEDAPISITSELHYASSFKRTYTTPVALRTAQLPPSPNLFQLSQEGRPLATLATHFADTREADFSQASSTEPLPLVTEAEKLQTTQPLPYRFLFLLILVLLSLAIWALTAKKTGARNSSPEPA